MSLREEFDRQLTELRDNVLAMGRLVDDELKLALQALETLDADLAKQVFAADLDVNAARFAIEEVCFKLIVTQQPAARDLRTIVAAMNIIVDLERAGDKAKDIAESIPHLLKSPNRPRPPELKQMGDLVGTMLRQCMQAYADRDVELAKFIASQDREIDLLLAGIFNQTIEHMAKVKKEKKVEATFEIMQAAQHLARVGDLATNVAERVIYMATGTVHELNVDSDGGVDTVEPLDR